MVEKMIYNTNGEFTKKQLWERLPRKIMYQTFSLIIDYLLETGKIAMDRKGKMGWIWDSEGVKKYLKKRHLFWKRDQR